MRRVATKECEVGPICRLRALEWYLENVLVSIRRSVDETFVVCLVAFAVYLYIKYAEGVGNLGGC